MALPHKPLSFRNESLVLGATIFVVLKSSVIQETWVSTLFAALGLSGGPNSTGFLLSRAAIDAFSLVLIIAVLERTILHYKTRSIRGEWVYYSSSSTWGYARIQLEGTHLRYFVDLYATKDDLKRAIVSKLPTATVGSGTDRLIVFSDGAYFIWYHIPPTRSGSITYAERHGLLTLRPTAAEGNYIGSWERTGCLAVSVDPATTASATTPRVSEARSEHASGSFYFFMRKEDFVREEECGFSGKANSGA